tara:strand:- start:2315 stop:3178 length:864 start_codon:yes stop_codon:yes gene_type:complete
MNKIKQILHKLFNSIGIEVLTKKQKRVLNRYKPQVNKSLESVIFFTTHKAASNFSNEILKQIENRTEYTLYDYGALIGSLADKLNIKNDFEVYLNKNYKFLFNTHSEIYGPQRKPLKFQNINDYKKIFFLRDPRDVLISAYYSFGYSHPVPNSESLLENFNQKRALIQTQSLDEYVLRESKDWIKPIYMEYKFLKESSKKECLYIKYNQFVNDTESCIEEIFNFFDFQNKDIVKSLATLASPVRENENKNQHKRSGKNNQWKTHLTEKTQEKLNNELNEVLKYWQFI